MKKIAVFLLCFSMLTAGSITAYADTPNTAPGEAEISTKVPFEHEFSVIVRGPAVVTVDGQTGTHFTVDRLSEPELTVTPTPSGMRLVKVTINGEDVTDDMRNGTYRFAPVYEDKVIEIVIDTEMESPLPAGAIGRNSGSSGGSGESGDSGTTPTDGGEAAPTDGGETAPADSSEAPAGDDSGNPATGIAGGVSIGSAALLALGLFRRKHSEKD